jgi:outer membrane protein
MIRQAAVCVAFLGLSLSPASAADLQGGYPASSKDGPGGYWVVTIGGYIATEPRYPGSNDNTAAFRPIIDIRRPGDREWINLPNDASNLTLFEGANWRAGVAADYLGDRTHEHALRGLRDIDYTLELGGFAEYYPAPFLRTRLEVLQGVTGAEGLAVNLAADAIFRPQAQWLFTAGPRLKFVNTQYQSTFFSVSRIEADRSIFPSYHASGGLNSAGVDATARYSVNERLSLRAFAEWNRLTGDAADSPIVRLRGSEDQWQAGVGASYTFNYSR